MFLGAINKEVKGFTSLILYIGFLCIGSGCFPSHSEEDQFIIHDTLSISEITSFRKGDILIQTNLNWMNGSSMSQGGVSFGHAAIVLENHENKDINQLLQTTPIFESVARRLPPEYQNRIVYAQNLSSNPLKRSQAFSEEGSRFRLRPDLSEKQMSDLIEYILRQENGTHSWRTGKIYERDSLRVLNKTYCSLLIWHAYMDVLGLDIDANHGFVVYPNDILNHQMFDGELDGTSKRIRF
ncbi:MAG: hypothetical protein KJO50_07260 [Bacteroidia bacterium]|nr:hypothetical protein [Bacteroidia bacterium]